MDFTHDDLVDAIEREVRTLFDHAKVERPPVDALELAQGVFQIPIEYVDEDEDDGEYPPRAPGRMPRRKNRHAIMLREDQTPESQQTLGARAIAKKLLPMVLQRVGVAPGTENRGAEAQLLALIIPRLMLPTKWFFGDASRAGYDLFELKEKYSTASYELIAKRYLDCDEPCVVSLLDDGAVALRKSNRFTAPRKLPPFEEACAAKIGETGKPAKTRGEGWTVWGWPTPGVPFRRIILRAVPDDV